VTPERFRVVVSTVLIVGVGSSALLIAAGFVGSLASGWEGSLIGAAAGTDPTTDFGALPGNLLALRPVGLAQAGLVVLVATPVVRVAASVIGFALEGDRLYLGITLAVLAILLGSLFILR
jgi:Predicted membrane protein